MQIHQACVPHAAWYSCFILTVYVCPPAGLFDIQDMWTDVLLLVHCRSRSTTVGVVQRLYSYQLQRLFARRVTGNGLLPLQQGLIDIQAAVLETHCPLFEYKGRGFLVTHSASTTYSFGELLRLKGQSICCWHCKVVCNQTLRSLQCINISQLWWLAAFQV